MALTAFGAIMVATNVFNNALRVDLDEYLEPYRKPETARRAGRRADGRIQRAGWRSSPAPRTARGAPPRSRSPARARSIARSTSRGR